MLNSNEDDYLPVSKFVVNEHRPTHFLVAGLIFNHKLVRQHFSPCLRQLSMKCTILKFYPLPYQIKSCLIMASKARIAFLIFSYFLLLPGPSYSQPAENFVQGKELKDGDELASANENFRLGFFKLSGKAYLGICYNRNNEKPSSDANRRTPIAEKSSVLTIDDYGNLKISYSGDQSIVLCSVQGASNTSAILLDTGNFRLHQIMNSDGSTKWNMRQSFDNTTDTLFYQD